MKTSENAETPSSEAQLSETQLSETLFLIFVAALCATHGGVLTGVRICAAFLAFLGLTKRGMIAESRFWVALTWVLAMNLVAHHDQAANHYWLTVYASAFFALKVYAAENRASLPLSLPRAFLGAVFAFATLHKIVSPYFFSGRLLGGYILTGNVFHNLLARWFGESYAESVFVYARAQRVAFADFAATPTAATNLVTPYPEFAVHCFYLALAVIAAEALIFFALLSDRAFYSRWMPGAVLGFVWATLAFRGEFVFFALVCILFSEARPDLSPRWKNLVLASALLFLAFAVSGVK